MKFSVVITVYNKAAFIAATIDSVLAQTRQNFEIVILNDGSTDDSEKEILKIKDSRIRYFRQENQGASAARNKAIKLAENDYIALLDADDYWFPFYLEDQEKSIKAFPDEKVFATALQQNTKGKIHEYSYSVPPGIRNPIKVNLFEASQLTPVLHSSSTVLHKSVFDKAGFYNPELKSGEDTDLYIRIGLHYKVVFNPRIAAEYIVRENSLFQNTKSISEKDDFVAYEKFEKDNPALKKFLDIKRYYLCIMAKAAGDTEGFHQVFSKINLDNLTKGQRFWIRQPGFVIRQLRGVKDFIEERGLRLDRFK